MAELVAELVAIFVFHEMAIYGYRPATLLPTGHDNIWSTDIIM